MKLYLTYCSWSKDDRLKGNVVKIVSFDNSGLVGDDRPLGAAVSKTSPADLNEQGWHLGQDTYAVGAMLFEAFTGQIPDKADPRVPKDVEKQIGRNWSKFLEKSLCPNLSGRFINAGDMLREFNQL